MGSAVSETSFVRAQSQKDFDPLDRSHSSNHHFLLLVFLLGFPFTIVAVEGESRNVTIMEAVWVGSTLLTAGDYKVESHGYGSLVEACFLRGSERIATVPATKTLGTSPRVHATVSVRTISETSKALESLTWRDVSLTFETIHPF